MIQIDHNQLTCFIVYMIIFSFAIACLVHATDDRPQKKDVFVLYYLASFIAVIVVFLAGLYFFLSQLTHFHFAAFCLITLKWSDKDEFYLLQSTDKVSEDDAVKLSWCFSNQNWEDRKYWYNLIDGEGNMQTFRCATPNLLERIQNSEISIPEEITAPLQIAEPLTPVKKSNAGFIATVLLLLCIGFSFKASSQMFAEFNAGLSSDPSPVISPSLAYNFNNVIAQAEMTILTNRDQPALFGAKAGYDVVIKQYTIQPFAGYYYELYSQDKYDAYKNNWCWVYGVRIMYQKYFMQWQSEHSIISMGIRFSFH